MFNHMSPARSDFSDRVLRREVQIRFETENEMSFSVFDEIGTFFSFSDFRFFRSLKIKCRKPKIRNFSASRKDESVLVSRKTEKSIFGLENDKDKPEFIPNS